MDEIHYTAEGIPYEQPWHHDLRVGEYGEWGRWPVNSAGDNVVAFFKEHELKSGNKYASIHVLHRAGHIQKLTAMAMSRAVDFAIEQVTQGWKREGISV